MISGIVTSNGHTWKQQRRVANVCLRLLGKGEKRIEHQIEGLAGQLIEMFANTKGQPFDPSLPLINSVFNVVCSLSFGHQFELGDKNFQKLVEATNIIEEKSGGFFHLMFEAVPWLMKRLPGPYQKMLDAAQFILSFARQEVEKHKQHYSQHEPEDFIDYYLLEMEKSKNDSNSTYNEENLLCCLLELFIAGTNTTISSLNWAIVTLANHPEIQEKVHKEIEDVFGPSAPISYRDRKALPYTNAVIHEILRAKYNILIALPRQSTANMKMGNFHIPKGTIIIPDLRSVLLDPEEWETPEEFNPNHFLDTDGNFRFREAFLPFGIGRRICLAENLARLEIFTFLINLLRTFRLQLPEGIKEIDETPIATMVLNVQPYKICAVPHHTPL
ncbi:cytochrome P450 2J5-like [Erythrolamprus reginae]|uniref:cytochrome P450 2J5-like n=1 Tax=Erythrolamprus reginae TaxID=121349 RepID=UPI00396CA0E1